VTDQQPIASEVPPHVRLIQMGRAFVVSRTVYAAAKLSLADHLASGPKSAAELAESMKVHAPSLHRLMRTLASLGILTEQAEQRFALTRLGEALKTGAFGSARSAVIFAGSPWAQSGWDNLVYSVETGKPGFDKANGMPLFDYLAEHPEAASLFSEMMVGNHGQQPSLRLMISRSSKQLSMLAELPATCWRQSLASIPVHAASCLIDPTS
jgi:hypothetical protein